MTESFNEIDSIFNEMQSMKSCWKMKQLFFELAAMCVDEKRKNYIDNRIISELKKNSLFIDLEKCIHDEDVKIFIVPNINLGDRINFFILACSYAEFHQQDIIIVAQDDNISKILSTYHCSFLKKIFYTKMNHNDLWLNLACFRFSNIQTLNWWSFVFQEDKFHNISKRFHDTNRDWYQLIDHIKRYLNKWDLLFNIYGLQRFNKNSRFIFDKMYVSKLFADHNIDAKKSVLLAPLANTIKPSNVTKQLFNELVRSLHDRGYSCFENIKPGEESKSVLDESIKISIPAEKLPSVLHFTHKVIGLRSGLCDLAHILGSNLSVIYPERPRAIETNFSGWSINEHRTDEYFMDIQSKNSIVKLICEDTIEI